MMFTGLPIPPSANHLWRAGKRGRFYRSGRYTAWVEECSLRIRSKTRGAHYECAPAAVHIIVIGGKGWRADRDLDNVIKPTLDLLRHAGVLPDDTTAYVREVRATFSPAPGKGYMACLAVQLSPAGDTRSA